MAEVEKIGFKTYTRRMQAAGVITNEELGAMNTKWEEYEDIRYCLKDYREAAVRLYRLMIDGHIHKDAVDTFINVIGRSLARTDGDFHQCKICHKPFFADGEMAVCNNCTHGTGGRPV